MQSPSADANTQSRAERDHASEPLVTVITPTYNRAALLPATIESVLGQDYPHLEHIVLDDGSTDNTEELLACMASRAPGRLAFHRHENMGEQRTVNRGFSLARGEIIMVVNSDDPLLPGAVSESVDMLTKRPDLAATYPDWQMIDEASHTVRCVEAPDFSLERMLLFHECHPGPGAAIRRRAIEIAGGRDTEYRYVADFDFWLRLALAGPIARISKTLATWRRHDGAASAESLGPEMAAEHVRVVQRFFERPDLSPEIRALRRRSMSWAHYAAAYHAGRNTPLRLGHVLAWAGSCPPNIVHWWRRHKQERPDHAPWRTIGRRLRGAID